MNDFFKALFSKRMLITLFMGFSSGLPLLLTMTALQAWMKDEGVDLKTIGLTALLGLPYTWKFLWAPIFDRYVPPFMGRRRGWLILIQVLLGAAIAGLAMTQPKDNLMMVAVFALLVTFVSASQDIILDAYRREILADNELGLGSSLFVNGYRVAMILTSSGALIMADHMSWSTVYLIMAGFVGIGLLTTLIADEPTVSSPPPKSLKEAIVEPFVDYFKRDYAIWILAFILFYKLGDTLASALATPFYMDIGFTKTQIGYVVKTFGLTAMLFGSFIGGAVVHRVGIYRSLWIFGIMQALSILPLAFLSQTGPVLSLLMVIVVLENLCFGMGTSAYVAFMSSMTNKRFTATQYALLSSLMGVPRVVLSAPTGWLAEATGWFAYYIICALFAIPGLLLLLKIKKIHSDDTKKVRKTTQDGNGDPQGLAVSVARVDEGN